MSKMNIKILLFGLGITLLIPILSVRAGEATATKETKITETKENASKHKLEKLKSVLRKRNVQAGESVLAACLACLIVHQLTLGIPYRHYMSIVPTPKQQDLPKQPSVLPGSITQNSCLQGT